MQEAQRLFSNTGIKFTTDGQRHLGVVIGTSNFRAQDASEKVTKWCNELHRLDNFAKKHNRMQPDQHLHTVSLVKIPTL